MRKTVQKLISILLIACFLFPVCADEIVPNDPGIKKTYESEEDELTRLEWCLALLNQDIERHDEIVKENQKKHDELEQKIQDLTESLKHVIVRVYRADADLKITTALIEDTMAAKLTVPEYLQEIHSYDLKKIEEYKQAQKELKALEETLFNEQAEREVLILEYEEEKAAQEEIVSQLKSEYEDYEDRIAKAKERAELLMGEYQKSIASVTFKEHPSDWVGKEIAEYAMQFIGGPYVWGGTSLTKGADCSGFVQSVFKNFNIDMSRTSFSMEGDGVQIELSEVEPGDIILYPGHVGIYIGEGEIVHAANSRRGITIDNVFYRSGAHARRIITEVEP